MKQLWMILIGGVALLALVACSPDAGGNNDTAAAPAGEANTAAPRLRDDYEDAMSIQGQLALGTVQLEETGLAVDEAQAAELLPLWQALQSLNNSDTAAEIEIDAVIDQIQNTMTAGQIQAIAEMRLTGESLMEMIENGDLAFGFGGGFRGSSGDGGEGGFPRGGFGGGIPGGGGAGGGFLGAPGGAGELSEDDIATRQAARESGALGGFQERALVGMAVRLMADKTGGEIVNPRGNIVGTVFAAVSEATDLSVEEIQAQMADGATLTEVIEKDGSDVPGVRAAMIEALEALPNAEDLDAVQIADDWLGEP